jgi:hypothetical protein
MLRLSEQTVPWPRFELNTFQIHARSVPAEAHSGCCLFITTNFISSHTLETNHRQGIGTVGYHLLSSTVALCKEAISSALKHHNYPCWSCGL